MYKDNEKKKAYERNWYKTTGSQKRKDANKRWEEKNVERFKALKSTLKCERCGESHIACLDFHHRDPSQKAGHIGRMMRTSSIDRLLKEIEKCIVLCSNCHRKEHYTP